MAGQNSSAEFHEVDMRAIIEFVTAVVPDAVGRILIEAVEDNLENGE
ncbi:MAG TPA: hypothetical protein VJC17_03985 [Candidatus Dojkabacteria bacterium]|nr:hypothetical protein [Candidatus Dojkabacteria bacterium]